MIKIAVDAMGGDFAPEEIIKGAVSGAREHDVGIILVGPQGRIQAELAKYDGSGLDINIVHTDEYLLEGEHPAYAIRKKRNASIVVATKLVRDGKASAVVGAGPTGGIFVAALVLLGTLEGLSRPVIGGEFLGFAPKTVMFDLGGSIDCRPDQLLDFGIIGMVYAHKWLNIPNPTIALLNNGAEEGKGNTLSREAYDLFKKSGLNFVGYVEGHDIAHGKANVVICDGFVGNVVIKLMEGMASSVFEGIMRQIVQAFPTQTDSIRRASAEMVRKYDYNEYGGAPLLGVAGICIICHGASNHRGIMNAVRVAKDFSRRQVNEQITELLSGEAGAGHG